jgi:hypothetical protein
MTRVLILAAGEARRFKGIDKQLLPVGDETIINRIVRQVKDRGSTSNIVTTNDEIIRSTRDTNVSYIRPMSSETVCDTLRSAESSWSVINRTIVLLGDVVYSKQLMNTIFGLKGELRVVGNTWEIFALSFSDETHVQDRILEYLNKAHKTHPAKLRTFYRLYCGFEPDVKVYEGQPLENKVFVWSNDWSNDMDSWEKYQTFVKEVVKTNKLDDRR